MSDANMAAALVYLERIAQALEAQVVLLDTIAKKQQQEIEDFGDHNPEHDPDYLAAIAAEAEARIQGGSTPQVARDVEVDESAEKYVVEEGISVNLLEQPRTDLDSLEVQSPGDKYILLARERGNPVYTAAVEIVYSNTAPDFWGTDQAGKQIDALVSMHVPF